MQPKKEFVNLETYPHEEKFRSFLDNIQKIDASENDGYVDFEVLKKIYKQVLGDDALADNTFDYRIEQIIKGISVHDLDAGIFSEPDDRGIMHYFINIQDKKIVKKIFQHTLQDPDFRALQEEVNNLEGKLGIYPDIDQDDE